VSVAPAPNRSVDGDRSQSRARCGDVGLLQLFRDGNSVVEWSEHDVRLSQASTIPTSTFFFFF
jgi:hypothetical protein